MELIPGNGYHGFSVVRKENIHDINGMAYLMKHEKSGASLLYVQSQDDNKVFFVSFRTPPEDDCGTPHILEHSVLCGSQKYPLKDPFNELAKGSLNTYLNALTYSDKTMYPVASRNETDFMHMMDVYLDAVFHPLIFDRPEIFQQEGWHLEAESPQTPFRYNGVVYNEMRGALSDPERILIQTIQRHLFPHTIYRFESGGDPACIPQLSYEKFLDFYRRYYQPSNGFFYLYGDMDIINCLKKIDQDYLCHYEDSHSWAPIEKEKAFSAPVTGSQPFSVENQQEKKGYLSASFVVGESTDPMLAMTFRILDYILLETNGSPLRQALLESGICEDVEGWYNSAMAQPVFSIIGKKADLAREAEFRRIISQILETICEQGLDETLLESALRVWEFALREEDYGSRPKGLQYGMNLMKSWLYGADPMAELKQKEHFEQVAQMAKAGYFQRCIRTYLLENPHAAYITLYPVYGREEQIEQERTEELRKIKDGMSEIQRNQVVENTAHLLAYQKAEEPKQILDCIPLLKLEDVSPNSMDIPRYTLFCADTPLTVTPLETDQVFYCDFLFDLRVLPEELLPYAGLLKELLGKMPTEKYSFSALSQQMDMAFGDFYTTCRYMTQTGGNKEQLPYFQIRVKLLQRSLPDLFAMLEEILFHTRWEETDRMLALLQETKGGLEQYYINQGHLAAITRSLSWLTENGKRKEMTSGMEFYRFLCRSLENSSQRWEETVYKLKKAAELLFQAGTLRCFVGCNPKYVSVYQTYLEGFVNGLKREKTILYPCSFQGKNGREGIFLPSKVQYNVAASRLEQYGLSYHGSLSVLKSVLDREYLWNQIRVMGGAYGCGSVFLENGQFYLYSYRDPQVKKTYEAFTGISQFLKEFHPSGREMTQYILGAINRKDRPLHNSDKAEISLVRQIQGITQEALQQERQNILSAGQHEISQWADLFDTLLETASICTVGGRQALEKEGDFFERVWGLC